MFIVTRFGSFTSLSISFRRFVIFEMPSSSTQMVLIQLEYCFVHVANACIFSFVRSFEVKKSLAFRKNAVRAEKGLGALLLHSLSRFIDCVSEQDCKCLAEKPALIIGNTKYKQNLR